MPPRLTETSRAREERYFVTLFEWLKLLGPWVASIISVCVLGWVTAIKATFAVKSDLSPINAKMADHDARLVAVEKISKAYPSAEELHREIADLTERMASMEARQDGIRQQLETTNMYLKMLVDKAVSK
jgi:uncharacterized protein YlxW (UPF0749 family)